MSYIVETDSLINDLGRVAKVRSEVANCLNQMVATLEQAESEGKSISGELGLEEEIEDLNIASKNLRQGVFRLLVLGDMKRGKSTFVNALIGENLLPSDVNPCTAVLTVLRYGPLKKVTIYFKNGKSPEQLGFHEFKQQYTIDPDEAKRLEQEKKQAFPEVDYAVVEYPLPLLEKGIEIVDSPGLNDTEARNELSLGYIHNCHAILFILRASQSLTLGERRYLDNYIKNRGLTVFFLINAWDEIRKEMLDPDNLEAVQEAENKVRQVFQTNLSDYCQVESRNVYEERVFELSSLNALRLRLKNPIDPLEKTGFPKFMAALNTFLTKERAIAELRQARTLARQTHTRVHEAVERRLPLLSQDVKELQAKISSLEPEFNQLADIREQFQDEIREMRDRKATAIADSFRNYVLNLGNTFETDFVQYQPTLTFVDALQKGKREEFSVSFKQAFEQYINNKISAWELTIEQEMNDAFSQLAKSAANYGASYSQVTEKMSEKLIGQKIYTPTGSEEENSPAWASWAMGFLMLTTGNVAGIALAGAGFDWKSILVNALGVIGIWGFLTVFSIPLIGITGPLGIALLGLGIGAVQADQARQELIKATKKEFVKYLPQIAQEQWTPINQAVKDCFDAYEREVTKRVNNDIKARKAELDNLLKQQGSQEFNQDAELKRLKSLDSDVLTQCRSIEFIYECLLTSPA
ncbi:dynamin family protein [Allocoleopsis franciscana]|uniref:Phosphotransferase system, fructose-specific IIC component n=1 Tax=Allocoleopsis franciscana PCC 7113 TaxID=1173027 RepID=K9WAI0_9CYAN|nr:dynamin family protein [Allocoleopsis franciscana]AFZ17233.1 phosphotransferase system, fructose-specific IIC component [Allocoleopsis franciscana PCC 7113]